MPPKSKVPLVSASAAEGEQSFETSISQLADIVERLESGELPLEDALALFERGMQLVQTSQRILEHAESRVEQLLGFDRNGQPVTTALDDEGEDEG